MNFDYSRVDFRFADTISEIETLIKETPRGFKEEIEAYHSRLIQMIDSGVIVQVPDISHRNLHQMIWVAAFMVYNNHPDFQTAFAHFFTEEANGYHGKFQSQRNRFNIWYDKTYIKPFLEKDLRYRWAADTLRADESLSKNDLHMPIEKAFSEVGI